MTNTTIEDRFTPILDRLTSMVYFSLALRSAASQSACGFHPSSMCVTVSLSASPRGPGGPQLQIQQLQSRQRVRRRHKSG